MSSVSKKSKKKKIPSNAILLDRKAFLSVIGITSHVLSAMSDEIEMVRTSKEMPDPVRKALRQVIGAHLQNVAMLSHALQNCVMDPLDPEGTRLLDLH